MKITLDREQAMRAVDVVRNFAEGASGLKVLQGVLVSADSCHVRLVTTDLAVWCQVEMDAQIAEPGEALVSARHLATVLKTVRTGRVHLRSEGEDVACEAGSSEVRLTGLDVQEFPDVGLPEGRLLMMPLEAALIDKVAYAVSRDETRYTLCGVRLEVEGRQLSLVATDGHRLSRFQGTLPPGSQCDAGEEPVKATLPVRLLQEGVRLGARLKSSVTLELYEKAALVRINGSVCIWSNLIEGQYPAYEEVLPSQFTGTVSVPKGVLSSAVSRLQAFSKGRRLAGAVLSMNGSDLELRLRRDAEDDIAAVERLPQARTEGTVPECGLRITPLSEALARLPDTSWVDVRFSDGEGLQPVVIQSAGSNGAGLLAVIMPVKV